MALIVLHFYLFILLLHTTICKAAADKRFSDLKRCADEECSMLLCRGKASQDFTGPDCRFLSFKKGETIYVYYKLSGRRTDAWAGSVGSRFGYFPKDLLIINHVYTDKELEVSAEETDFVCFDTGFDKFDNYEIDTLLGSSVLSIEGEDSEEENEGKGKDDLGAEKDLEIVPDSGTIEDFDREDDSEELSEDTELEDREYVEPPRPPSEKQTKKWDKKGAESDTRAEVADESIKDDLHGDQHSGVSVSHSLELVPESTADAPPEVPDEPLPKEDAGAKYANRVSEGQKVPDLTTNLGSTFDAVTSDDEDTWRVTPYYDDDEEEGEVEDSTSEPEQADVSTDVPLLSFNEENSPPEHEVASDPPRSGEEDGLPETLSQDREETEAKENKNMWTSLGTRSSRSSVAVKGQIMRPVLRKRKRMRKKKVLSRNPY
ncbi:hypothetical protein AAFF_G00088650 [Aldrovandia affinis]|uniref:Transport and Golgi organization protein 1 homolog n=1 Tax=Aldrovandia affinis TaxID=143900 RepID=A0AAD7WCD3_9TELE|nr:hypothetical protein AAFF_G00088650 [Aldrovandia affinis]